MGSKFSSVLTAVNGLTNLKIVGAIDEDNELASLESKLGAGIVVIDLSAVERINSVGVRDWVSWLGRIEQAGARPVFVNCSPAMVSQINVVHRFIANGLVKSFYAPYYCPNCQLEKLLRLEARALAELAPISAAPSCRCDKCGSVMDFDEMEASFFSFLNQTKKLYRDPNYENLLQALAGVSQSNVAALPGVRLPPKRSPEPKVSFSPSLVRRLIQNILPTDAEFRAFCSDYFPEMQARLSDDMDRLQQVNLLLETERLDAITEQLRIQAIDAEINWNDLIADLQAIESPEAAQVSERRDEIEQPDDDINEKIRDVKRELQLAPTLQEREVLGERYCLLQVVGRGGFATVWKARDRKTQRVVAVKVLHAQQGEDTRRMDRFIRGAQRMQELDHPHIVRVLQGPDKHRGFHYFVMDYVPGGDLGRAVSLGKITVDAALKAVLEIGSALTFAHQHDLIHRDVKPENILLDAQGKACLTDFDLISAADLYVAPEAMLDAGQVDPRADVYSLAMTTLFVLHGQKLTDEVVYERDSFFAELKCSSALRELVRHGTRRKPENRLATVAAFCAELGRICASEEKKPAAQPSPEKSAPQPAPSTAVEVVPAQPSIAHRTPQRPRFAAVAGFTAAAAIFGLLLGIFYWKRQQGRLEQVLQQQSYLTQERERMLRVEQGQRIQAVQELLRRQAQDENLRKELSEARAAQAYLELTTLAQKHEPGAALTRCAQIPATSPWRALAKEECNHLIDRTLSAARQVRRQGRCDWYQALLDTLVGYAPDHKGVAQLKELPCGDKSGAGNVVAIRPAAPPPAPIVKPPPAETSLGTPPAPIVKPPPPETPPAPIVKPPPPETSVGTPPAISSKPKGKGETGKPKRGASLKSLAEKDDVDWLDSGGSKPAEP